MPLDLHIASGAAFLPLVSDPDVARMALEGLLAPRKTLQPSLFYDEEGCRLFYAITKLPEYYLTRTEFRLLETVAPEVAGLFHPGFSPPRSFPHRRHPGRIRRQRRNQGRDAAAPDRRRGRNGVPVLCPH